MSKKWLRDAQVTDAAHYVDEAADWARDLTQSESRGPGDLENSWRRLEARYGISPQTFWSLRYRRPKEMAASIYFRLRAAYAAECDRQMRRLKHEISIARAIAGPDHPAVGKADAVASDAPGEDGVSAGVPGAVPGENT